MPKTRVLVVFTQFKQGGSERFVYELCRSLDKDRYHVEVLTRRSLDPSEYYYPKLVEAGIPVHRGIWMPRYWQRFTPRLLRSARYRRFIRKVVAWPTRAAIGRLAARFDLLIVVEIDAYFLLQPVLPDNRRMVIHLMSNRFQFDYDLYDDCQAGREYRFVLMDPDQRNDLEGTPCAHAETCYVPLSMDLTGYRPVTVPLPSGGRVKIGVFIRLSRQRPIEMFFYCLRDLLKTHDATLHLYGSGDRTIFSQTLRVLNLRDRVVFEGHRQDLGKALREEGVNLIWSTLGFGEEAQRGGNGPTLGYGSVETGACGVPMVFWNLHAGRHEELARATGGAVRAFNTVEDFVGCTRWLLDDPSQLQTAGLKLREYILEHHDIRRALRTLEPYYLRAITDADAPAAGTQSASSVRAQASTGS